ncbi:LOW QUALITY PROTEIN: zinc finger E-box-binding homeobox 1b [Thalassophryne amazonica]|uniref:LOW QUALITY PROTEIN: zinc finger E-box-binding homeobox 1b n=1 Tax=Thalassophryne amazonica TaxID=390379 RepID=UPI001470C93F|nr:LOW QUALITY PROTEIN: zinc finger E-box-binding homeobox 1b [Thalassophryne amazonica]
MADGPRCKRRKQANPRRNSVTHYSNVVEAGSESDDEDKLHIVEEEGSLADGADCDSTLPDDEHPREPCWDRVREDCVSDGDDDVSTDALMEEMLQQGDTAVIFPEAPEDEPQRQGTPEANVHDDNGTPDAFSQLLTCPYCARGYKRYSSLKEHIKYRHEKNEDNFSCSQCSYTFAYRTQLERHMTAHKAGRDQRHITQSGGNRKFKCTECGKAFKYKHHLKEHLRIHSGEKPYECSNCKKRFSHSGSYSSHISSKKCISVISVNGRPRRKHKTQTQGASPALPASHSVLRTQIREKLEHNKPLQEQAPLKHIKSEPVDYEYKPTVVMSSAVTSMNGGVFNGGAAAPLQGTVQAVVLPTVGLVISISINLEDLQNALKVAVDGNVIRQVLESNTKGQGQVNSGLTTGLLHPPQQQVISAISLPIVGQDGNAKIIINYSLEPNQAQFTAQNLKKEPQPITPDQTTNEILKSQKLPEDLTFRSTKLSEIKEFEEEGKTTKTCLLCDNCPGGLEALNALKHCKKDSLRLNGAGRDKSESGITALLSEGGLCTQPKNLLSLLKAYFALNAEPTKDEMAKISDSVSLPVHVVKKWFDKMQEGQISLGAPTPPSEEEDTCEANSVVSLVPEKNTATMSPSVTQDSPTEATPAEVNGSDSSPTTLSPLNLAAGGPVPSQLSQTTEGPLDLSLPKLPRDEAEKAGTKTCICPSPSSTNEEQPLNLTCTKKEASPLSAMGGGHSSPGALYSSPQSANPIKIVTTQIPTLVAIADQSHMPCLRALSSSNQAILIPQLAYTYTTTASSPAGTETQETIHLSGIKEDKKDSCSEATFTMDEQNDSDSGPLRKKMKKTDSGMYACDLCDKIFQKSSSLLRHKYEHTGKRPHECGICSKAFKHKHHLIEHMRLHSGEKPYQCDKCGKRFSHSGSYSQHMNHRYSYCKKEAQSHGGGRESTEEDSEAQAEVEALSRVQRQHSPPSQLDLDERGSSTREDEESEEEEEEEEEAEDVDDIHVVQIGDEGGDDEEQKMNEEGVERVIISRGGEENSWVKVKQEEEADMGQERAIRSDEVEEEEEMEVDRQVTSAQMEESEVQEAVMEENESNRKVFGEEANEMSQENGDTN